LQRHAWRALADVEQAVFIAIGERAQQHGAHHAEDGGVGADAEARVRATVIHSVGTRDRERMAIFKSRKNDIQVLHSAGVPGFHSRGAVEGKKQLTNMLISTKVGVCQAQKRSVRNDSSGAGLLPVSSRAAGGAALARRFDEVLRPFGADERAVFAADVLNRPEPPPMGPVATLLGMDRTTLTAALKPLERRGLLKISPDPKDRRSRTLQLTAKGHALLIDATPVWEKAHREIEHTILKHAPGARRCNSRALNSQPS
jgi:DNA-binding MarR family transcriptional regulator